MLIHGIGLKGISRIGEKFPVVSNFLTTEFLCEGRVEEFKVLS